MELLAFILIFLVISVQIIYGSLLNLEIDSKKYHHCTIFVIRDSLQNNPKIFIHYPQEQKTNPYLNNIISHNQAHNILLTWVIKDSKHTFGLIHRRKAKTSRGYSTQKYWNMNNPKESCTLIFTDPYQIFYGSYENWNDEVSFTRLWALWLTYITSNGKLAIATDRTICIAITGYTPSIFGTIQHHEALFISPFVVLFGHVSFADDYTGINSYKYWWACRFCKVDRGFYRNLGIFTGYLNASIMSSFLENSLIQKFPLSWNASPALPTISVEHYAGMERIRRRMRIRCEWSTEELFKHQFTRKTLSFEYGCTGPGVTVINLLAEKINFTTTYGFITPAWRNFYFQAYITITDMHPALLPEVHPNSNNILQWDIRKLGIYYCEEQSLTTYSSIFAILGEPFDWPTWICIGIVIFITFVCIFYVSRLQYLVYDIIL